MNKQLVDYAFITTPAAITPYIAGVAAGSGNRFLPGIESLLIAGPEIAYTGTGAAMGAACGAFGSLFGAEGWKVFGKITWNAAKVGAIGTAAGYGLGFGVGYLFR